MCRYSYWCLIAIIIAVLAGCSVRIDDTTKDTHTIYYDEGGSIPQRLAELYEFQSRNVSVVVPSDGICMSACTLYLGLPDTCVSPNSTFKFHGPVGAGDKKEVTIRIIASKYPPKLRRWYYDSGAYKSVSYKTLSGQELISMGVKKCPS